MRQSRFLVVTAMVVLGIGSGCCCKKGFVLRGDWSLELNRIPNLTSHGPRHGDSCVSECETSSPRGCTHGGEDYSATSGEMIGPGVGAHRPAHEPPPAPAAQTRFHPVPTQPVFESESHRSVTELYEPLEASAGWRTKPRG